MSGAPSSDRRSGELELNRLLLLGVLGFVAVIVALVVMLYLLPTERLHIPELQPAVRVARVVDFPVGTGRVVNWGDQVILVVRRSETGFFAVQGSAPTDGCLLRWDREALRIVSPCDHLIYDLRGNVVTGLSTLPLRRYGVYQRDSVLYVTGS
ncbi:MAG: hypothetical protein OER21_03935 [Gemmatimonadota bacterium]|nr:hypothetical protein [Gemmatimonadota bacterium]